MLFVSKPKTFLAVLYILILTPATCFPDSLQNLTEQLVSLRSEVEQLNNELVLLREEHKQRMKQLYTQHAELEGQLQRDQRKTSRLRQNLQENQEKLQRFSVDAKQLQPALVEGLDTLEAYIQSAIPFKVEERLAATYELRQDIEKGVIQPQRAAAKLWALIEDEMRMTHENGVYRQPVTLGDETVLADVARVGTVMLFFSTADNRQGFAEKHNDQWVYTEVNDKKEKAKVIALFDAFRKQIRTGYFELPNALAQANSQ
jgi:hypothetical protein